MQYFICITLRKSRKNFCLSDKWRSEQTNKQKGKKIVYLNYSLFWVWLSLLLIKCDIMVPVYLNWMYLWMLVKGTPMAVLVINILLMTLIINDNWLSIDYQCWSINWHQLPSVIDFIYCSGPDIFCTYNAIWGSVKSVFHCTEV